MSTDTKRKVLIIEDEKPISEIIKFNLTREGYDVETAYDGQEGLDKALSCGCSLVLLDIMLPIMSGFEVCKKIRESSEVPIIMLTAKEEEADKVLGLELGADDYITKPFGMRELIARIKANLRRSELPEEKAGEPADVQVFGRLEIDMNRYEVRKDGVPLDLTLREFELLRYLAKEGDKGLLARAAARGRLGLRVLRRHPHRGRHDPAPARKAGGRSGRSRLHHHEARHRLFL